MRILLVEDDEMIGEAVADGLKGEGLCRRLGERRKLCDYCPGYHPVFFGHS